VVASGGITVEQIPAYLEAGAYAVCLGRELADPAAAEAGDVDGVAEHAAKVLTSAG
jgi:2-keto-3-deoxy-6-phosphogluconate aldolase